MENAHGIYDETADRVWAWDCTVGAVFTLAGSLGFAGIEAPGR